MSPDVEPEEAQALMDLLGAGKGPATEVEDRDFRRPRRLGADVLDDLRRRLFARLPALQRSASEVLRTTCYLELASVGEANAEGLFDDLEPPFSVLRFAIGGQPAWLLWDALAAVGAVERVLGSSSTEPEARRLSRVERRVLADLLQGVAEGVAEAIGHVAESGVIVQTAEELGSWRDAAEEADPHRLALELAFEGSGEPSTLILYLPGFAPRTASEAGSQDGLRELPAHLREVSVEVSARIPGCELPLNQLLSLEEGDVIPLDARLGDPAQVVVEGEPYARGRLGTHQGYVAIRIEHLERDEENP